MTVVSLFMAGLIEPPVACQPLLASAWVRQVYLEDLAERMDLTPGLRLLRARTRAMAASRNSRWAAGRAGHGSGAAGRVRDHHCPISPRWKWI